MKKECLKIYGSSFSNPSKSLCALGVLEWGRKKGGKKRIMVDLAYNHLGVVESQKRQDF